MKAIEQRLRQTIGLDPEALGPASLERALRRRMNELGLNTAAEYETCLNQPAEWQEFIERVLVTETCFFRDPDAFDGVVRYIGSRNRPPRPTPWRLLSLPCASGEEPYSLAMALTNAQLSPSEFHIDAVDISERALSVARNRVYGKNSFRNPNCQYKRRFFHRVSGGLELDEAVAQTVSFRQGNILASDFSAALGAYDIIFFRNLLIYLDDTARQKALQKITRLLAPDGLLCVGPAEMPYALSEGLTATGLPHALVARQPPFETEVARRSCPPISMGTKAQEAPRPTTELIELRRLIELGRLAEAEQGCRRHLNENRDSAEGYHLLGLAWLPRDNNAAAECFRKALYLKPDHYESLVQMCRLAEMQGDTHRARNFKRRAERLVLPGVTSLAGLPAPQTLQASS